MKRILPVLIAVLTATAFGQGVRFDGNNTTSAKNVPPGAQAQVLTLPYSTVKVCGYPAVGDPCTNSMPIYSDQALTQLITQPLASDSQGRFGFWVPAALYSYSVTTFGGTPVGTFPLSLNSPPGPQGPGGIGCGSGSCVVTNPSAPQTTTQLAVSGKFTAASIMPVPSAIGSVPNIIWSDDMETDPDGAMNQVALLHWVDTGQARVLAMVADSSNPYASPTMHIINTYYGYGSIPVGAYQGGSGTGTWTQALVAKFAPGDTRANYPPCVTTLRTALAAAANSSVIMVSTGFASCFYPLMTSAADGISSLTGAQLIKAKVIKYVAVAGEYPTSLPTCCGGVTPGAEFNFQAFDPADWSAMLTAWTAANGFPPIYFIGYTDGINGGTAGLPASFPASNPASYGISFSGFTTRPVWGELGLYYAIFGNTESAFTVSASGTNAVNGTTGANTWTNSPAAGHFYLTDAKTVAFYEARFDGQRNTGAEWFIPYNQAGALIYQQLECSFDYGCIYGGGQSPLAIGPYTETYGPTGNLELNKPTGVTVRDFEQNGVSKMAIGVDDGSGGFMLGTNAGDSGIRITSGQNFYFTNAFGTPGIGINATSINTYATGPAGTSMGMDDQAGGRIIAKGPNTTTPETMLLQSFSSNLSVTRILASMNAAGFIQIGATTGRGVDQAGNAAFTSLTTASATLLTTGVPLTNGAAAAAGTLTNAPTAGNPTKWVPINDNGTTRFIPAW